MLTVADALVASCGEIIEANALDLAKMERDDPRYDRLLLDAGRIEAMAAELRTVASLPSPLGLELENRTTPEGLHIRKVSVPFGVVGMVFEARPNVCCDSGALCLKSGNAVVLKAGSDAHNSSAAIVEIWHRVLAANSLDINTIQLMPMGRESTRALLEAVGMVDLVIPRGSAALIDFVRRTARVPVIETGAGICHTYFHSAGDKAKGRTIVTNAKTRRVGVCNALDCLIIDHSRTADLPFLCEDLAARNVAIYADKPSHAALSGHYPAALLHQATAEHFGTEFLDYKLAIRTVEGLAEAIEHIDNHSSKHSEAIVSESSEAIDEFYREVDAACLYANVSTAMSDGAQMGLGAEIGISTQKLHARGPMALRELTTYKYLIDGKRMIRQ